MSLYERYELLDLNRDAGVKTFEARQIATGRPVKVHLFVHPSAPLQAALLHALDKLQGEELQRIVERGKHEGTPYVVTDRLMDYPGLSEWVQAVVHSTKPAKPAKPLLETAGAWKVPAAPAAAEPAVPAPPSADANSQLNQEFTDLFATAERPIVADSLLQAPRGGALNIASPPRPSQPQAAAAPPVKPEPGEFTRMFQSPASKTPTAADDSLPTVHTPQVKGPAAPAPRAIKSTPAASEPGEFTRMFQAPGGHGTTSTPAAPASSPVPAAAKSGPGEFTRFFETPSLSGPLPQSPAVQQPLAPQGSGRSPFNPVSEFTRTFGKPGGEEPAPPPAAAQQQEPGEFTRMFHAPVGDAVVSGSPAGSSGPPAAQPPSPAPQAAGQSQPPMMGGPARGFSIPAPLPAAPQASGPGEYTRQFSAPAQLTFGQTSATPSVPAASPPRQAFAPPAMAQPAMPNMTPAPAPPRKGNLPLILGIVGIVAVAAMLILFFAMRPK